MMFDRVFTLCVRCWYGVVMLFWRVCFVCRRGRFGVGLWLLRRGCVAMMVSCCCRGGAFYCHGALVVLSLCACDAGMVLS